MAKNTRRDRSRHKTTDKAGGQQPREDSPQRQDRPQASPADMALKAKKRFGHN